MAMEIRKGGISGTEAYIELLYHVRDGMENKDWFFLDTPDEIREMMTEGVMELWVAMDGETLAGAFSMLIPGLREYNYGYDLGLSEPELMRVINMDTAAVHPDYRGQGLQRRLLEKAEREIAGMGKRILLCTIHPENRFSLNNALKLGYRVQKELPKYGSVRYLLRKDV